MTKMITDEIAAGIPSTRVVLGGFSQGGALALFTGLTTPHKLAGIFGLSSYLVLGHKIKALADEGGNANKDTPVFMGHGDADEMVKYAWGQKTAEVLRKDLGCSNLVFKTYPNLPHSADPDEIDDVETFLHECLPPLRDGEQGMKPGD